jgi:hypothetical protein
VAVFFDRRFAVFLNSKTLNGQTQVRVSYAWASQHTTYVGEKRGASNAAFSFWIHAIARYASFGTTVIRFSSTSIWSTRWCK